MPCTSISWQRSGRSTRPAANAWVDNNNDVSSGRSEHARDAEAESSSREAAGGDTRPPSAAIAEGAAADTAATPQNGAEHTTFAGVELPPTAPTVATTTATAKEATANAAVTAGTDARATLLLPLGNLVVVEVDGCSGLGSAGTASCACTGDGSNVGSGNDGDESGEPASVSGDAARRLVRLDDRVEILHCRGEVVAESTPGAEKLSFAYIVTRPLSAPGFARLGRECYLTRSRVSSLRPLSELRRSSLYQYEVVVFAAFA